MKKYMILICLIIIFVVTNIIGIKIYSQYHKEKILKDENRQVEVLKNIIEDFKTAFNFENDNIYLDETCFKNLINDIEYSLENIKILKQGEQINNEYEFLYTMYFKYNLKEDILTITLKDNKAKRIYLQRYKLDVKDKEIIFERFGMSEVEV